MPEYSILIRGGSVLDGTGAPARAADVAVAGDRIAAIGDLGEDATAPTIIDATGLSVAPGFVNMLSHAYFSLLQDGRGVSDLLQGVTTEVFSEGPPTGPLNDELRARFQRGFDAAGLDIQVSWSEVGGYFDALSASGTALNVCTFIGTWPLREIVVGPDDRALTSDEMRAMVRLVEQQMEAGAFGIGSALIYPPATYASTNELVELCRAVARHGGRYHSHIRSEGNRLFDAMRELLEIGNRAGIPVEQHHLKIAGQANWPKLEEALEMLVLARETQEVTANMYTYNAGGTALHAAIPPRFHDGGPEKLRQRLTDRAARAEIKAEMEQDAEDWENLYLMSGGAAGVLLLQAETPEFASFLGQSLEEIAGALHTHPIDLLMDIVLKGEMRAGAAYFIISEDNVRRQVQVPWVTFGSDAGTAAAEPPYNQHPTHPREYGTFARLLGHYVRDEGLITLEEAVRRLSSLPCSTLGLRDRGRLAPGQYADAVVFDPATVEARATYQDSHRQSTGVRDVFVNGVAALRDGAPTGAMPGRAIRRGN